MSTTKTASPGQPPAARPESKNVTIVKTGGESALNSKPKPWQFEKVLGARKVWGTMRETTVKAVTGVIFKLCPTVAKQLSKLSARSR